MALLLAMSLGLAGMASASANHTSHCMPSTERADAQHAISHGEIGHDTHAHDVTQTEDAVAGAADCLAHFCSAVLTGLVGFGTASHTAKLVVVPEPENLRALSRILGLYRPPSI